VIQTKRKIQCLVDIEFKKLSGFDSIGQAFKPGLLFIEGNLPLDMINKTMLDITLKNSSEQLFDKVIRIPITDPYIGRNSTTAIDYSNIQIIDKSNIFISIKLGYFLEALARAKDCPGMDIVLDNSSLLGNICQYIQN